MIDDGRDHHREMTDVGIATEINSILRQISVTVMINTCGHKDCFRDTMCRDNMWWEAIARCRDNGGGG